MLYTLYNLIYLIYNDLVQGIEGVPKIQEGLNPATWMLEVSTPGMESQLGVSFAEQYNNSELARYATMLDSPCRRALPVSAMQLLHQVKEKTGLRREAFQPCHEACLMGGFVKAQGIPFPSEGSALWAGGSGPSLHCVSHCILRCETQRFLLAGIMTSC